MPSACEAGEGKAHAEDTDETGDPFALDRALINATRHCCDMRVCRRARRCALPQMPCRDKNMDDLRAWKRRVYLPYLRKRYPTVQWGAPAGTMELQLEAARAAEAQGAANGQAKMPRRRRRLRRRRRTTSKAGTPPVSH